MSLKLHIMAFPTGVVGVRNNNKLERIFKYCEHGKTIKETWDHSIGGKLGCDSEPLTAFKEHSLLSIRMKNIDSEICKPIQI